MVPSRSIKTHQAVSVVTKMVSSGVNSFLLWTDFRKVRRRQWRACPLRLSSGALLGTWPYAKHVEGVAQGTPLEDSSLILGRRFP